jgi:uncharacterized protein
MKMEQHSMAALHVRACTSQGIQFGSQWYDAPFLLSQRGIVPNWTTATPETVLAKDWEPVLALRPALVLIGAGLRGRFFPPVLMRPLIEAGIGYECMTLDSACRTWNIVLSENRNAVAAFLFDAV